jgi:hypothetical protein
LLSLIRAPWVHGEVRDVRAAQHLEQGLCVPVELPSFEVEVFISAPDAQRLPFAFPRVSTRTPSWFTFCPFGDRGDEGADRTVSTQVRRAVELAQVAVDLGPGPR